MSHTADHSQYEHPPAPARRTPFHSLVSGPRGADRVRSESRRPRRARSTAPRASREPRPIRASAACNPCVQADRAAGARVPRPIRAPFSGRKPCIQARSGPRPTKSLWARVAATLRKARIIRAQGGPTGRDPESRRPYADTGAADQAGRSRFRREGTGYRALSVPPKRPQSLYSSQFGPRDRQVLFEHGRHG